MQALARALALSLLFCLVASTAGVAQQPNGNQRQNDSQVGVPAPRPPRAGSKTSGTEAEGDDATARWYATMRQYGVATVEFKKAAMRARAQRKARERAGQSGTRSGAATFSLASPAQGPTWIPIGPSGASYEANGANAGNVRDSGRARKFLPHPTDPDTVYFLTSAGGLWVTHNFTAANTTWTPLTDELPTTSGGSMAFGRTPEVIYLGTGDPFDVINIGGSMTKSTDGGQTWSDPIDLGAALSVRDVLVDSSGPEDVILVATNDGLYRSVDSGASYAQVLGGVGELFQGQVFWSLVRTSAGIVANAQTCAASATGTRPGAVCATKSTMYLSSDLGASWSSNANWTNTLNGAGRTTLAVGAPGDSIVYAFAENAASTDQDDLYKSTDGGASWTKLFITSKVPINKNSDNPNMDLMHGQSWYNQMILVDPRDQARNTIYLGGNLSSAKTTDGGATWTLLSTWLYGLNGVPRFGLPYVHADFQTASITVVGGTPTVIFGNDGGIYVSKDDGATWSSDKNNGLQTMMAYTIASTPDFPSSVFGGFQDNGTRVREGETEIYDQSVGGDGISAAYSQNKANLAITTLPGNGYRFQFESQIPDVYERWIGLTLVGSDSTTFYTPITIPDLAASPTGQIFFTASVLNVYEVDFRNNAWNETSIGNYAAMGLPPNIGLRPSPRGIGVSPSDLLHIGVPAGSGNVVLTANGGTNWSAVNMNSAVPGFQNFIESVTYGDNNVLFVTSVSPLAGAVRVAKSVNGGASWTRADSGLPDVQIEKIYFDPSDPSRQTVLAATFDGVYRSTDQGGSWVPFGNGLPNVFVRDIYMPPDGSFIRIATYGRGFWELPMLQFSNATLTDDVTSCDHNGSLDNGETGTLAIQLRNDGSTSLNSIVATVTSTNPAVSFPDGNVVAFAPAASRSTTVGSLHVALAGAVGIQQLDFQIAYSDPSLGLPSPSTAVVSIRGNTDILPNGSTNDDFGINDGVWTVGGTPESLPNILNWRYLQISTTEHRWQGLNSDAVSDQTLTSPSMTVGSGNFSFSFEQRYYFANNSGMVLELSTDDGSSWTDIGASATPAYPFTITAGTANPLAGRRGYSRLSYPAFTPVSVNLGTTYAGQNVRIRFRVGSTSPSLNPGVEIRNFTTSGLTNTPFTLVRAHSGVCQTGMTLDSDHNPSYFGGLVTFTASVTGGLTNATGSVDFSDAGVTIGSGTLDSGGSATFATSSLAVGQHTITATYGGDSGHAANSAQAVQTVNQKLAQTITFGALADKNFGDADFTVSASASSGLAVSFGASGSCSVSGSSVHLTGAGSCTITASQPGDSTYEAAPDVPQPFNIGKASQTITFGALADKNLGDPDFTVSASASSGLAVSFGASGNCSVTGSTVHLTGAGSCTITASQSGDANYSAAPGVPQAFSIGKGTQTITFGTLANKTFGDPDFSVSASASSGLTVSFGASGNCSVTGSTVHLTGPGSCTITASQAGDANFSAAPSVPQSFNIGKGTQTITFGTLANKSFGDADFTVSASASSGLTVSFGASGNCSVTGSTVHLTGAGSCTVTASQSGDANYSPATSVPQSFNIAKASQTISFGALANKTFGDPDFAVSASSSSGLAVSFAASGNCTVTGTTVHLTSSGACSITASQAGNTNYNAATPVTQSFSIVAKQDQTITFAALANKTYGNADFTVSASASSGLTVSFGASGNCSVSGNTVHLTGAGSCSITASQAGNGIYNPAPPVTRSFSIAKANQTITFPPISKKQASSPDFPTNATASSGLPLSYTTVGSCTVNNGMVHITGSTNCTITASQPGDVNYNAAPSVQQSFNITGKK